MDERDFQEARSPKCANCMFSKPTFEKLSIFDCRRYPIFVTKLSDDWCGEYKESEHTCERPEWQKDDDVISDDCGNTISAWCLSCHRKTMQVVRPGKFQCRHCG